MLGVKVDAIWRGQNEYFEGKMGNSVVDRGGTFWRQHLTNSLGWRTNPLREK